MDYFNDIYEKRLNRFGDSYLDRIQGQREKNFDLLLEKSPYRVDFLYSGKEAPGLLERYKQDQTETFQYLLVKRECKIPIGTILMIDDEDAEETPWMTYIYEKNQSKGYNRYTVMKMTNYITWQHRDNNNYSSWAYMFGPEDSVIKSTVLSGRQLPIYSENQNANFLVMPTNENIKREDYLIIGTGKLQEQFTVTGYDIHSTPGVEYITIEPTYLRDDSPQPQPPTGGDNSDYFWFNDAMGGGV